jgi:hypothetical protein
VFGIDHRRGGTRISLAIGGILVATALTGCGAGQVSQVATQEPAVNGTIGAAGDIKLRNVHLQAVETGDALQPGKEVPLIFSAANNSPDKADRLVGITSDVGSVALTGDTAIPAGEQLAVGIPDGVTEYIAADSDAADPALATLTLTEPIRNGLTYGFTFTFEHGGQTTLEVPISAGNALRQDEAPDAH